MTIASAAAGRLVRSRFGRTTELNAEPMPLLTAEIAPQLVAACRAGADRLAAALGEALEGDFTAAVGDVAAYASTAPAGFAGPGLVLLISCDGVGLAAVIPVSAGLAPAWCANPDAAAAARLIKLAREFSAVLAPAGVAAESIETHWVGHVGQALGRAGLAADAMAAPVELRKDGRSGTMSVIWPLATPENLTDGEDVESPAPSAAGGAAAPAAALKDLSRLPHYSRSLLKIRVPISVQLAARKETVREVINLAPGSIIKFDKNCDELLQMIVGEQPVAEGEAVKIGDKFGFRVSSMLLPREHFLPVRRPRQAAVEPRPRA
jgi:flagellar motor switch/type III secretory pathway protein FliN